MSTKRASKGKAGDTSGVGMASGGRPSGREGDTKGEENFVPAGLIAPKEEWMMRELFLAHEGVVEKILEDEKGRALFALIRVSDGPLKAQVSGELRDCMRQLARYGLPDEAQELASAFKRLNGLPANADSLVYHGELDASARLSLALIIQSFQRGLGNSLQEIERLRAEILESPLNDNKAENGFKNLRAKLKRRLNTALDTVLHPSSSRTKIKGDSPAFSLPWGPWGLCELMHPSLAAIIHARRFVEKEKRLPTKMELRNILEEEYKADMARWKQKNEKKRIADSTWSDIWKEAGLAGLKKESGDATSAKKGRKR
jgi:hypothetical protein